MREEKSFVYTLVLGVCMLLSLLLIGKMMLRHTADAPLTPPDKQVEQGEQSMELQLDENDLAALVVRAIPFAVQDLKVTITRDGTVTVGASVSREALQQSGLAEGSLRTALLFLPDPCVLSGAWRIRADEGTVQLETIKAELAGLVLPEQVLGTLTKYVTDAVNATVAELGVQVGKISFEKGSLIIYP